jgi:predicted AAA+ superfamily ATPase
MFVRKQILEGSANESLFLWGARQTGKSTLLKMLFPKAIWFDLLKRMCLSVIKIVLLNSGKQF